MKVLYRIKQFQTCEIDIITKNYPAFNSLAIFIKKWLLNEKEYPLSSSGSTGKAKTITVTRSQVEASAKQSLAYLDIEEKDQFLLSLSPKYIASIMMMVRAMIGNNEITIIEACNNPLKIIGDQKIDFISLVPIQIYRIIEDGMLSRLEQIRNVLIGGAPLNQEAISALSPLTNNIYMTYGMTETVSHIALMKISQNPKELFYETIGDIQIGTTAEGCLELKGSVTNHESLTTTDVVQLVNDKKFVWLGRADNIINTGGIKIHPETIENVIHEFWSEHKLTNDFFIAGSTDDELGESITLFVEGTLSFANLIQEVNDRILNKGLDKYHKIRNLKFIDRFERTSSSKVKRKASIQKS